MLHDKRTADIFDRQRRREAGDRSSPDRAMSRQRLVNCLLRISSSKGAAGEDEIVSGHVIDHELALLARVERQVFENFDKPADLHAFG